MDRDLNRSVRFLEDALSPRGRSLFQNKKSLKLLRQENERKRSELSLSLDSDEIDLETRTFSFFDETLASALQNRTVTGAIITANKPWETSLNSLFIEFLEVIQAHGNLQEIFDTILDLSRCCTDMLKVIHGMKTKVNIVDLDSEKWLENERNTWRLVYCLYRDRINANKLDLPPYMGISEKRCIEALYKSDIIIREWQLIIDWLECNAADREDMTSKMQHFTDQSVGWENTLHQLQSSDTIVFKSTRQIVTQLHPDAQLDENLPLHDLDMEDEERLCKKIFLEIRCGRLSEAQKLCIHCGHPWRAALLEGWRLYHDPNLDPDNGEEEDADNESDEYMETDQNLTVESIRNKTIQRLEKQKPLESVRHDTEGNMSRDIWKNCAWKYCQNKNLNIYERAAVAAHCGALDTLLSVCNTWEDQLWAYLRTVVDIKVETEIRDFVSRTYIPMPDEYWNNKLSLESIFEKILTSSPKIREEAISRDHIIQKLIILNKIPQLMAEIDKWLDEDTNPQFLRFLAHLVVFLKQIGQGSRDDVFEKVVKAYVKCLMEMNEPRLVAFYVSHLGPQTQIKLFASFCENVMENNERMQCLDFADEAGLDVIAITKQIVENMRSVVDDMSPNDLQRNITDSDRTKISALDWVLFYPSQIAEAIYQSNRLISYFLMMGKVDAAKAAFSKIPANAVEKILSRPQEDIPEQFHDWIKEHLSYKAYLDAHEAFNDWFKYFHHSKPAQPPSLPENASFAEKVAQEHKVAQHNTETERWKMTVTHLAKIAKTLLYNVLLFPNGGWLTGANDDEYLRAICIPEAVMLLYSILSESGEHSECIRLADIIACEKNQLYKVYTPNKLEDILKKFFESSIALLDEKKDMWGVN